MTINVRSSRRRFAIINGDDFGFSHGVNQAIIQAHVKGILTSTSLMVTGNAFAEAVALAKAHPNLAVGLHLVLIQGKAVLPPEKIPHLVDRTGNFPVSPVKCGLCYQFNRQAKEELRQEIRAQLSKFRQTGLTLAHVDGHLHLHSHPFVLGILADFADEFGIKTIRIPAEELRLTLEISRQNLFNKLIQMAIFSRLRNYGERLLKSKNITFADRVYGLLQTGQMNQEYLLRLIPKIQADWVEIYLHPAIPIPGEPRNGPEGAGQIELDALLSQKVGEAFANSGFELVNYLSLPGRN